VGSTDLLQRGQTPVRRVSASSIGLTRAGKTGELVGDGFALATGRLAVR
jgi:hypothetical protein